MNISGLGASSAQNAVVNNAKDLEQEIKKLEQKKLSFNKTRPKQRILFLRRRVKKLLK
ncbi:hypothetical protein [Fusibacter bizertensis]